MDAVEKKGSNCIVEFLNQAQPNYQLYLKQLKHICAKAVNSIGFVMQATIIEQAAKGKILIVRDQSNVVGFCNFNVRQKDGIGVIYEIVIIPSYRRQGLAKQMIETILTKTEKITLKCPINNKSNAFYEKIGTFTGLEKGKSRDLNVWEINKKTIAKSKD